jgi:hypothetical protein
MVFLPITSLVTPTFLKAKNMKTTTYSTVINCIAATLTVLILLACGDSGSESTSIEDLSSTGTPVDIAKENTTHSSLSTP